MVKDVQLEDMTDRASTHEAEANENDDQAVVKTRQQDEKKRREQWQTWVLCAVATVMVFTTVSLILYFGINNPGPAEYIEATSPRDWTD